jgi:hypothetical protein
LFCHLRYEFADLQSILAEVGIEIIRLVIPPIEFLILHTVFAKLHGIHLGMSTG